MTKDWPPASKKDASATGEDIPKEEDAKGNEEALVLTGFLSENKMPISMGVFQSAAEIYKLRKSLKYQNEQTEL